MKGMIGIVVTALMLLSVYFFYVRGKHEPVVLQGLTVSPMVSEAAYPKGKPLSGPEVDGIINGDDFTSVEVTTNKAVGAKKDKTAETGMDVMGGYYEAYALAPEEEVAQVLDQGAIGVEDTHAVGPGGAGSLHPSEGNMLMNVKSVNNGAELD